MIIIGKRFKRITPLIDEHIHRVMCAAWAQYDAFFILMRVHARLMTSNLSFTALVYALDVFMIVCRHT